MASTFDTTWAALDPGDDWAAQVIQSIFPVSNGSAPLQIGTTQTVIGTILGQLAGFALCLRGRVRLLRHHAANPSSGRDQAGAEREHKLWWPSDSHSRSR